MTQKVIIGRASGGVSINGYEFLLSPSGSGYAEFDSKEEALHFVREELFPEATDEEILDYITFFDAEKAKQDIFETV